MQEDHDQRLKEAVKSKFSDAIDLLLPTWVPWFDYPQLEWIEQEIFPDPPKGQRRVIDILAKIPTTIAITSAMVVRSAALFPDLHAVFPALKNPFSKGTAP